VKRILITGSCGFIGSHFVDHVLANTDWYIIGIDSLRHKGDSLRIYQDRSRYDIYAHDLSAPISNRLIDRIGNVDYIVNFASESHVDRSIQDPVPFCENNFKLMLNILEYARKAQPEIFIQISTDEVYGAAPEGIEFPEWSTILPSNPYSASKSSQEALCISYYRTYNLPIIITNCTNIFGEMQDPEKFVPLTISKINKNKTVPIHADQSGKIGARFYLHARNKADALLYLLKYSVATTYLPGKNPLPDRYNISGDIEIDNLKLAQIIADIMEKPLLYEFVNSEEARPGHDGRYALDDTKLREIGWYSPIDFQKSIENVVKWTLDHPEWLL
jgi:dTDP-glucose 4,6-dehydratase